MRRANGTGSVYKRSDKKRRKPYIAVITIGTNQETGKPIRKSLGSFEKATEARRAIDQYTANPPLPYRYIFVLMCWRKHAKVRLLLLMLRPHEVHSLFPHPSHDKTPNGIENGNFNHMLVPVKNKSHSNG